MKAFTIYTLRNWKRKEMLVTKLTGTENSSDDDLLLAIRRSGVRFQDSRGTLLSDGQVLAYILKEKGER